MSPMYVWSLPLKTWMSKELSLTSLCLPSTARINSPFSTFGHVENSFPTQVIHDWPGNNVISLNYTSSSCKDYVPFGGRCKDLNMPANSAQLIWGLRIQLQWMLATVWPCELPKPSPLPASQLWVPHSWPSVSAPQGERPLQQAPAEAKARQYKLWAHSMLEACLRNKMLVSLLFERDGEFLSMTWQEICRKLQKQIKYSKKLRPQYHFLGVSFIWLSFLWS